MSFWGNDMSVYVVVANGVHHGSYRSYRVAWDLRYRASGLCIGNSLKTDYVGLYRDSCSRLLIRSFDHSI